jgi:hypothetical protein
VAGDQRSFSTACNLSCIRIQRWRGIVSKPHSMPLKRTECFTCIAQRTTVQLNRVFFHCRQKHSNSVDSAICPNSRWECGENNAGACPLNESNSIKLSPIAPHAKSRLPENNLNDRRHFQIPTANCCPISIAVASVTIG